MAGRLAGLAFTCAVGAGAFLLPPGTALSNKDHPTDIPTSLADPKRQSISILCVDCGLGWKHYPGAEGAEFEQDERDLHLDFSVTEDGRLLMGGGDLYPKVDQWLQPEDRRMTVTQTPHGISREDIQAEAARAPKKQVSDSIVDVKEGVLTAEGDKVVEIHFMVQYLESLPATSPAVHIKLLHTSDNELLIMQLWADAMENRIPYMPSPPKDVEDVEEPLPPVEEMHILPHNPESPEKPWMIGSPPPPFRHHPHGPPHFRFEDNDKDCDVLPASLCRLKNFLQDKVDTAMGPPHRRPHWRGGPSKFGGKPGCGRFRPNHEQDAVPFGKFHGPPDHLPELPEGWPKHHGEHPHGGPGPHGRPHHMRPHHHHHHHHGRFWAHHYLRAFFHGVVAILVPVLAGIGVGMSVSLLGLIIGRLIGFLWVRLVRGGRRGYASVALEDEDVAELEGGGAGEKISEELPRYEDSPAYEELASEKKDKDDEER